MIYKTYKKKKNPAYVFACRKNILTEQRPLYYFLAEVSLLTFDNYRKCSIVQISFRVFSLLPQRIVPSMTGLTELRDSSICL